MTEVYIIFFRLSLSLSLFFKFIYFKLKKKNKKEIRRCTARICDGSNGRVVVYLKTLGISLTMLKPFFVCVCFLLLRKRTHDKSPCDCVDDDGTRCTPKTLDYGERERKSLRRGSLLHPLANSRCPWLCRLDMCVSFFSLFFFYF